MALQENKIFGLQIARAFAVILVVLTHAIGHPYPSSPGVVHLFGREGVTIFFVISGYIMALICSDGPFDLFSFIKKRVLRVVPLYYFVTFIVVIGLLVVPSAFKATVLDMRHLLYSLAFLPAFSPAAGHGIVPMIKLGWTLNYELFFYLSFAALHRLSSESRAVVLLLVFSALTIYGQLFPQSSAAGIFYTDSAIMGFPVGVLLATFMPKQIGQNRFLQMSSLIAGLAIVVAVGVLYDDLRNAAPTQLILVIASAGIVYALAENRAWGFKGAGGLAAIGDASYSIYLFHMFAITLAYDVGRRLMPADSLWVLSPAAFIGGMAGGLIAYIVIEKPLMRAVHRYTRRNTPAAQPVTQN